MYYVVGSGPSGISCAYALLRKGLEVTLLDTGLVLEPARQQQLVTLEASDPGEWRSRSGPGAFLRDGSDAGLSGIPLKLVYGSDFPYRQVPGAAEVSLDSASLISSYARGGFSNVWGSAVLPYRQRDLRDWPLSLDRLAKHYAAVFDFMPLAARRDGLAEEFPLYARSYEPLGMSRQASSMLGDMERHRDRLASEGIRFGASRIAVHASHNGSACAHCGLCMYGCPYHLIYSSSATLHQLRQSPNFHYRPGLRVDRVDEFPGHATISAVSLEGGGSETFSGERVYLACGVLETTALLLRSLDQYDRVVSAADSQYFLLPILRLRGTAAVRNESLHTLAQLFLEIDDPGVSPHTIHLQAYTYNDLYEAALRSALGPLRAAVPTAALLSRLLLLQGYLHSSHSARIQIELRRRNPGPRTLQQDSLHVAARELPAAGETIRALVGRLFALRLPLGALPLKPLLRVSAPGRGFHTGGTFPMSAAPQNLQTDLFGRPAGLRRVHAVDSSIFPTVPATTITLTAMANAHRIGDELDLYA